MATSYRAFKKQLSADDAASRPRIRAIAYDALDRPFEWTDALNHVTSVEYDANANVTKRTNGLTKFRTYTYDKLDRLKTDVRPPSIRPSWSVVPVWY